ncbi:flagellar basal body rod protein FlgB [Myxococcota bacterium]|nr:flagellar basal body rod protein FlgB [Myxococcota bacterium]
MRTFFQTVDALERAMTFHRDRHTVLAGNLANVNTPGYRPLDLVRVEEKTAGAAASVLATTNARHVAVAPGSEATDGTRTEAVADGVDTTDRDGNAVAMERELAKLNANRTQYAAASELVSRRLAMLRYGASDGTT